MNNLAERHQPEPRRYWNERDHCHHVHITQGEAYVTDKKDEMLTTILGSCVAGCIRDPVRGIGGMNHFLLPEGGEDDRDAMRYGVNAMELLINEILKKGGDRSRLEAKLFGGANVISAMSGIGSRNAEFARRFLANEGIPVIGGDVGGSNPRRVQYWPATGRARQMSIATDSENLVKEELLAAKRERARPESSGSDVELF